MNITFAPKGILQIDGARIIFRNFAGAASKFNREGDRNFALVIEDEAVKDALIKEGWNVKVREPREPGDSPFMTLPVKVKFNERGPQVFMVTNGVQNELTEETVAILDDIDILSVDLDLRPYDWEVNGKTGRTAYLSAIRVFQRVNRFAEQQPKYNSRRVDEPSFDVKPMNSDDLPF